MSAIKAPVGTEEILREANDLLASLGMGSMSATAYDTAWVARIPNHQNPQEPMFPAALDWLLAHQHADGSWGAELPFAIDRVVCTLAALVTLASSTYRRDEAQIAVRRAILCLNSPQRPNLRQDAAETVGFELILPELARQASAPGGLGLRLPYQDWAFVEAIKADKLRRIPPVAVYGGPTTLTTSLEYLGDGLTPALVHRAQASNGSFGVSPSASAYVFMQKPDPRTESYLRRVATLLPNGGVCFLYPFEIFETAWVLYYLGDMVSGAEGFRPCLERLSASWTPSGVSWTSVGLVADADDSAVVMRVLSEHGHQLDTDVFRLYEADEYFYCFPLERNPSVSSNAHILETLRRYPGTPERRRMTLKLVHYLEKSREPGGYWMDKWHASPLYATDQAIRALAGLDPALVRPAAQWLLETQHEDGSWGFAGGTVEETAFGLSGLMAAAESDSPLRSVALPAMGRGASYLMEHLGQSEHPALWRGKALYSPHNIVKAIILGTAYRWLTRFQGQGA